ncbi:S1C family serine protease [Microcella frigidaquae]|uniref:Putative serine protease PepD n=1 Tax=Microcella frigidaquae TaxID=424758 RepID=A0A840X8A6_9MICO|nr:trypsin-like peptidase domain-containing protein [Microcella frigidaquae]MBB5617365.1 putative serine protease PepD [Microcella frigidaquae]NHN45162.1 PDZ domain-containing protein [Microcella frigidaquae]
MTTSPETPAVPEPDVDPVSADTPAPTPPAAEPGASELAAAPAEEPAPALSEPAPATPTRSRPALAPLLGMLTVGALIGGVAGGGVVAAVLASQPGAVSGVPAAPSTITVNDPGDATMVTAVVAKAMPAVVTLTVGGGGTSGNGSGVILSEDGYVLTNNHVATLEGATLEPSIRVTLSDGRIFPATLVGSDPIADLAVVKLEGAEGLPTIEFADSDALNVGDRTVVIGAPLGLAGSVSNGIVSALNRSITVRSSAVPGQQLDVAPEPDNGQDAPFDFWDFDVPGTEGTDPRPLSSGTVSLPVIQTDAAINPGNSGGALLDDEGRLIGIVVAIATAGGGQGQSGSIGVGFSIPANFAQRIATELIENGTASHGLLGATVTDALNDPRSEVAGALIDSVVPGGAAEVAGLRAGDIITEFNGVPIAGSVDLTAQVRVLPGGANAELVYVRDGAAQRVEVTLGELQ